MVPNTRNAGNDVCQSNTDIRNSSPKGMSVNTIGIGNSIMKINDTSTLIPCPLAGIPVPGLMTVGINIDNRLPDRQKIKYIGIVCSTTASKWSGRIGLNQCDVKIARNIIAKANGKNDGSFPATRPGVMRDSLHRHENRLYHRQTCFQVSVPYS